jgi:hypothetical protein
MEAAGMEMDFVTDARELYAAQLEAADYYGVPHPEVDTSGNWKSPAIRVVDSAT